MIVEDWSGEDGTDARSCESEYLRQKGAVKRVLMLRMAFVYHEICSR